MFRASIAIAPLIVLLTACGVGPSMPVPESPSPSAGPQSDQGWLVTGQNDYLNASMPVCSDEELLTAEQPEFFGAYLEEGPGMPDDWQPGDVYNVDANGILLEFDTGKYSVSRFDGVIGTDIGTFWETFGTFTFERDGTGVISGGSGTGKTRIIHEDGDVENLPDTMTFSVAVSEEPTWCNIP